MAKRFKSLDSIAEASVEDFYDVRDIGDVTANSLYVFFRLESTRNLIRKLKTYGINCEITDEELTEGNLPLNGKSFVVTGTLKDFSRQEVKRLIEKLGGTVTGAVSKNTAYVVVGSEPGSKYDKALKLEVDILMEPDFYNFINEFL